MLVWRLHGLCWAWEGWACRHVGTRIVSGEVLIDSELTLGLNIYVLWPNIYLNQPEQFLTESQLRGFFLAVFKNLRLF